MQAIEADLEVAKIDNEKLKESIETRFQNFDPFEFEEFIKGLFLDMGFEAHTTSSSGDFGADIILEDTKTGEEIAIQVKRYKKGNKVGTADMNQVVGAKSYYGCDKAMMITTSSCTKPAKKLARLTDTEIWEWEELERKIYNTYSDQVPSFYKTATPSWDPWLIFSFLFWIAVLIFYIAVFY
ncbi:restriction endonuclease [Fuchsiella alkaliacetigena]|uniref:restriction endonuclease n=1 Tax=Fuchsiella alkaliacetigena TaxID=957042 RepID=UPI00200A8C80|nr:restriction endonuclease [Fuchsiella alkaliacetigena]MCK8825032.1 restriction endonuclease [Fuchsiella alkaliacetigena]